MTSISDSVASAETRAAPKAKARNAALDRARTFLTLVVVLHHAVIPYTYFGHTDAKSWIGFDAVVLATDSFFMAMFFFLSGLFVWPSLAHKAPQIFIRDRLLRLGLPFAIAAFTIIPIAYYAIALRQHPDPGFSAFWWKTITVGPWPSGPIWFVWVLLAFDLTASLLYRLSPRLLRSSHRSPPRGFQRQGAAGRLLPFSVRCHRGRLYSGAALFRTEPLVRVRTVRRSGQSRAVIRGLLLHRSRCRGSEFQSRRSERGRTACEERLGLGDRDAGSVLPVVGLDHHQA